MSPMPAHLWEAYIHIPNFDGTYSLLGILQFDIVMPPIAVYS
jgi:hypothetical protein